jgi:acyl carrier protein
MTRASIRAAAADAIGELTGYSPEKINETDDLVRDLGVDSMVAVRLLVAIEDRIGTMLPDGSEGSLVGARTVAELVERLAVVFAVQFIENHGVVP